MKKIAVLFLAGFVVFALGLFLIIKDEFASPETAAETNNNRNCDQLAADRRNKINALTEFFVNSPMKWSEYNRKKSEFDGEYNLSGCPKDDTALQAPVLNRRFPKNSKDN